jgi:hypothetical protein
MNPIFVGWPDNEADRLPRNAHTILRCAKFPKSPDVVQNIYCKKKYKQDCGWSLGVIVLQKQQCVWRSWVRASQIYSNIRVYPTRCKFTQFILSGNCFTYFGCYFHPSSGAHTTVSTASGNCHTVTAICRSRGVELSVWGVRRRVLRLAYATDSTLKPVPSPPRERQIAVTVWQLPDAVDTVACAPDDG